MQKGWKIDVEVDPYEPSLTICVVRAECPEEAARCLGLLPGRDDDNKVVYHTRKSWFTHTRTTPNGGLCFTGRIPQCPDYEFNAGMDVQSEAELHSMDETKLPFVYIRDEVPIISD
jgi:hypothetical protein